MPLTSKGRKIRRAMRQEYGARRGDRIFYASERASRIHGVERNPGLPQPLVLLAAAGLGWYLLKGKAAPLPAGTLPSTGQPSGARPRLNPCAISGTAMTGTLQWVGNGGPIVGKQDAGYSGPTGGWQCLP